MDSRSLRAGIGVCGKDGSASTGALIQNGWVMMAHAKIRDDEGNAALNRLQTAVYGGTFLDDMRARDFLAEAGFAETLALPTPPGAPAITAGRR